MPQRGELVLSLFGDFIISHNTSGIHLTKKENQARVGHELKNQKKSEPLNPFWGGTGRAHHPLRYLCWWSYVWDVICWFGIGMVQSACHALVGITVTFIFCGARDETSCLMCTV